MKQLFTLVSVFCLWVADAQNASDTTGLRLDEVVITGFHRNDSLLRAPASIGIVTAADFTRNNASDISTSINLVPGVLMQSGSLNTNRITIRGIGARTPFGTNKIRAFFGPVPLTSGDSETTIEDLNLENLSQAEIVKGPLSSLYGAGLGGAILLNPAVGKNEAFVSNTHGSFGLVQNNINGGLSEKQHDFSINYHSLNQDGWRTNSAYRREGLTVSATLFKRENSRLSLIGNHTYLKAFIPSSISASMFANDPQAAAPTWLASKGYEQYRSLFAGLGYEFKIGEIENATSVFASAKVSDEPRPFDILKQDTKLFGFRTQFSSQFKNIWGKPQWVAGAEFFTDGFDGGTFENLYQENNDNGSLVGNRLTLVEQDRKFWNFFGQLRLAIHKKLDFQAGANYNATSFGLTDIFPERRTQDYRYDPIFSPQASLVYKASANQSVYISWSRGFSLPGISETLTENGTINPEITPETGSNFEIGAKGYFLNRRIYAEVSAYRMIVSDLLVARRIADDQYVGVNAGKTLHSGVEILFNGNFAFGKWTVQGYVSGSVGKYEFSDFNDRGVDYSGNELTGVPSSKGNAGLTFRRSGFYISTDYLAVAKLPINDANTIYNSGYALLNFKSGYRFKLLDKVEAHFAAGINNAADVKYASMVLVNAAPAGGNQPRYFYPGLPVNYYGQFSVSYGFN